ncbi:hypothetical protein OAE47_00710 [Akkermansiaceae bacterium]|nr:hypothetical protein [Akkermansiaceae bacterium]
MNHQIDISLVSGRRPELLEKTLASFQEHLFKFFEIETFRVNLDPFGGNTDDHERSRGILLKFFPEAKINEPEEAGFGKAVRHLWSTLRAPFAFHLEDDWIAHEDIKPEHVFPLFEGRTRQLTLLNEHKRRKGNALFDCKRTRSILSPLKTYDLRKPLFTTSPSFIDSSFARICAELMNPALDPEKQFYNGFNEELESFANFYRNRFLIGQTEPNVISDIGRDWRDSRHIEKSTINGVSSWKNSAAP